MSIGCTSSSSSTLLTLHIRLLHNQEGTDFTITCGEREWRVHRLVLSMHSDVFSHACNGAFKVLNAFVPISWI